MRCQDVFQRLTGFFDGEKLARHPDEWGLRPQNPAQTIQIVGTAVNLIPETVEAASRLGGGPAADPPRRLALCLWVGGGV